MTRGMQAQEPRKRPRQGRSQATFDAIVEAAAHIVERDGYDRVTTNDIAARAGVSIGSLYQYFPTKEAVLVELIRRKRTGLRQAFDEAYAGSEGQDPEKRVRLLVEAVMGHQYLTPNLARFVETANEKLAVEADRQELEAHIGRNLTELLAREGIAEPDKGAFEIVAIVRGLVGHAGQSQTYDRAELSKRASVAVSAYIAALKAAS